MIFIETITNPEQNKKIVSLVYYSMRNKYTLVSNPDGLTFNEVRKIISGQEVSAIKFNDRIVGIIRTEIADRRLKLSLDIDVDESYLHIGMIYISKNERGHWPDFERLGLVVVRLLHPNVNQRLDDQRHRQAIVYG